MMVKKPYPLDNKKATKIFISILHGKQTVSDIAKNIHMNRTATYQNIKMLQNMRISINPKDIITFNILKPKEKRKGWEIDLDEFYMLFLIKWSCDKYDPLSYNALTDKKSSSDLKKVRNILIKKEKKILQNLILGYAKNIFKQFTGSEKEEDIFTLQDLIDDFDTALPYLLKKYNGKKIKIKHQKLILKYLNELHDVFLRMSAPATEALEKSFKEIK